MEVRWIEERDIPELAQLTERAFLPTNNLRRLGTSYLERHFFPSVMADEGALGAVALNDGKIVGYVVAFLDAELFYKQLRKKSLVANLLVTARNVATLKFTLVDLWDFAIAHRRLFRLVKGEAHFGPFALSPENQNTGLGGLAILSAAQFVFKNLASRGVSVCWGTVDSRNENSWRMMEALRFARADNLKFGSGRRVLYRRYL